MGRYFVGLLLIISACLEIDCQLLSDYPTALCDPNASSFDGAACVRAIKALASDNTLFWYGTPFNQNCPPSKLKTVNCLNFHEKRPRTLAQALLGIDNPDLSRLDRVINIDYTSDVGSYSGCGTTVQKDVVMKFSVNPLSKETHQPWNLRQRPVVSWKVDNNGDLYTWVMYDAGFKFSHAIYMNIPENDFSRATVVQKYGGPLNTRFVPNTYTFLIFRQPGYIIFPSSEDSANFNVTQFAKKYNFDAPIALSWLLVSTDVYAVDSFKDVSNCAAFIEKEYNEEHKKRGFLPDPLEGLSVFMKLEVNSPEFTYSCDAANYTSKAATFSIDPIGQKVYKPALLRTETTRNWKLELNKYMPREDELNDKCFILLMVDPDIPPQYNGVVGDNTRPLGHMVMVQVRQVDGRLSGNPVLPYIGPLPPDDIPHTYYFLLYEDPNCVPTIDPNDYSSMFCPERLAGRCFFDVLKLENDLDLKLAGVSWLRAKKDHFVNCFYGFGNTGVTIGTSVWVFMVTILLQTLFLM